jgi:alkanesulfonate monooxygenase SsuD/methylene tetrahydromethanopterin reductase-like flavin-dependent oxidoreductase (luciferase family)
MTPSSLHLAVALDGAGWHPAAWRQPDARPTDVFSAPYWAGLVQEAERGLIDFVTFEDSLGFQSSARDRLDGRTDEVRGRLDAVLIAARCAPVTSRIGLVPTATTTHTEPFHISKAIATLDYVSTGRAGVRVQVSSRSFEAPLFGRRTVPAIDPNGPLDEAAQQARADLFDEAADFVEVVRRLWDSWEDDAEIRDVKSGRFIDRHKLHYIDFEGRWFSVKGPSITPRPPQGQPLVTALAHNTLPYRLAARGVDVVYITPHDPEQARTIEREVRAEQEAAGRAGEPLQVFADLVVFLDDDPGSATRRKAHLDELHGAEYRSDAFVFVGTPDQLADLLLEWAGAGLAGYRLRPGAIPHDLLAITGGLVPALQARGAFRRSYEAATLRGLLGLSLPPNRYAEGPTGSSRGGRPAEAR